MTDTAPPDTFRAHLIELIAAYQRAPSSGAPLPRYDGPRDSQTESILVGLGEVARRMWTAEETLARSQNPHFTTYEGSDAVHSDQAPVTLPPVIPATSDSGLSIEEENASLRALVADAARVCNAVSKGDLNQKIIVPAKGSEMAHLKENINAMVDKLGHMSDQVTGILRDHCKGKLGPQITVPDAGGAWFVLVGNANRLCAVVTNQVRSIAQVTSSVREGDLTQRISIQCEGEMSTLKVTINDMVDNMSAVVGEVIDLALEVGTFGILGRQVPLEGVEGSWADLTRTVNRMASAVTAEVRSISGVAKAVAHGDLNQFVEADMQGEMLDLKLTVNSMVSQLSTVANQVSRVSLEVGTEGILGGQANVPNVQGTWKVMADNVNLMASNWMNQTRSIAEVAKAIANGDLTKKIEVDAQGEFLELKIIVNHMTESLNLYATEVTRIVKEVGMGMLGHQVAKTNLGGAWKDLADYLNALVVLLTDLVRSTALVATAVTEGDLNQKIELLNLSGEADLFAFTINAMVDQLTKFAAGLEDFAVNGTQGEYRDFDGTWRYVTRLVNTMARGGSAHFER